MNCDRTHQMLADYLGDELDAADREAFEQHLAGCHNCRAEAESLQAAVRALRQLPPPPSAAAPQPPPAVQTAVLRLQHHRLRPLAYAATLLIGVGIGWFARPVPPAHTPAPGPVSEPPLAVASSEQQVLTGKLSPFVRNAIALSTAFSRPADR